MTASFWKRFIISPFTTSLGGLCRPSSAIGTPSGSASGGSVGRGCSTPCSRRSPRRAPPPTSCRCSTRPRPVRMCRQPAQKGAERPSFWPPAGRLLDQDPPQARLRRLPIAFDLTPGQASDSRHFSILLDLGPDITPRAAVGDTGYDSKANREAARSRGICPVIPTKTNAKNRPAFFPKALYRARARIEQCVGKLKRFKRIALRCEKTARNYASFVALGLMFILAKSVHRT